MPKYPRACNNRHFHEKWGSGESDLVYINLRRSGLSELAKTFESFLKVKHRIMSPTVTNICTDSNNVSTSEPLQNTLTQVMLE